MSPGVGELDVYPSIWGHWAGGPPGNLDDVKWLDERLAKIFKETPVGGEFGKDTSSGGGGEEGLAEKVKGLVVGDSKE